MQYSSTVMLSFCLKQITRRADSAFCIYVICIIKTEVCVTFIYIPRVEKITEHYATLYLKKLATYEQQSAFWKIKQSAQNCSSSGNHSAEISMTCYKQTKKANNFISRRLITSPHVLTEAGAVISCLMGVTSVNLSLWTGLIGIVGAI